MFLSLWNGNFSLHRRIEIKNMLVSYADKKSPSFLEHTVETTIRQSSIALKIYYSRKIYAFSAGFESTENEI